MRGYSAPKKMKSVGDLFDKYRNHFKAPQASVEKAFVSSVKKITNFDIDTKKVSYTVNSRVISLNLPSVLKTEIKFKEKEILTDLNTSLGVDVAPKKIL
jgi:hypothetical protein